MYCDIYNSGVEALEDLVLAQKMIFRRLTGNNEDCAIFSGLADLLVTPLLGLSFKVLASRSDHIEPATDDGILYVNPPTEAKDYDDAYHDAKRLFIRMFGQDQDFLVRNQEEEEGDLEDE